MLQAVKGTMDKLEAGVLETKELLSIPGMGERLMEVWLPIKSVAKKISDAINCAGDFSHQGYAFTIPFA